MSQNCCRVCYGTSLTYINGLLVCDDCGTQSQAVEELSEYAEGTARRRLTVGGSSTPRAPPASIIPEDHAGAKERLADMARTYISCIQQLLKAQAAVIVDVLGVHPDVRTSMRHLWMSILPMTGFLDYDINERFATSEETSDTPEEASGQQGVAQGDGTAADAPSATDDLRVEECCPRLPLRHFSAVVDPRAKERVWAAGKRKAATLLQQVDGQAVARLFNRDLHPNCSLVLCYMACLLLRQPVTPLDVIRAALEGRLPYMDMEDRCSTIISSSPEQARPPSAAIRPTGAPSPTSLVIAAGDLAQSLGLQLPNVNGEMLLLKASSELFLPEAAYLVAHELYRLYFLDSPLMNPVHGMSTTTHPYLVLAAVLCMAVRICYGLDGESKPRLPGLPDPPGSWLQWAEARLQSPVCRPLSIPQSVSEVKQLQGTELQQYLTYCRVNLFVGHSCSDQLRQLRATLEQIAASDPRFLHLPVQTDEPTSRLQSTVEPHWPPTSGRDGKAADAVGQARGSEEAAEAGVDVDEQGHEDMAQYVDIGKDGRSLKSNNTNQLSRSEASAIKEAKGAAQDEALAKRQAAGFGAKALWGYDTVVPPTGRSDSYRPEFCAVLAVFAAYSNVTPRSLVWMLHRLDITAQNVEEMVKKGRATRQRSKDSRVGVVPQLKSPGRERGGLLKRSRRGREEG